MKNNLDPKVASALCYLPFVGWIVAIVMLVIDKNAEVRFNAAQALVLGLGAWLLMFILGMTIILAVLVPLLGLGVLVLQLLLAFKAYQGEKVVLPVLGQWAEKLLGMISPK